MSQQICFQNLKVWLPQRINELNLLLATFKVEVNPLFWINVRFEYLSSIFNKQLVLVLNLIIAIYLFDDFPVEVQVSFLCLRHFEGKLNQFIFGYHHIGIIDNRSGKKLILFSCIISGCYFTVDIFRAYSVLETWSANVAWLTCELGCLL